MDFETELLKCHGSFIAKSLIKPWYPLNCFLKAILKFFNKDLLKEKIKPDEKKSKIVNSQVDKQNNDYDDKEEDNDF